MIRSTSLVLFFSATLTFAQTSTGPTSATTKAARAIPRSTRSTATTSAQLKPPGPTTPGTPAAGTTIECTPIVIDGVMYLTTVRTKRRRPRRRHRQALVVRPLRRPRPARGWINASGGVNRGVAYWSDGKPAAQRRILLGTHRRPPVLPRRQDRQARSRLRRCAASSISAPVTPTTATSPRCPTAPPPPPPSSKISSSSAVSNGEGHPAAPGDVRAFDVRTGKEVWRFHTVPRPGESSATTWDRDAWKDRGGANAWGGLSVDAERGMLFAGPGSAGLDFYGGDRQGDNLFANCTLALDARTGKRVWHFQTLHHDLWDHDPLPARRLHRQARRQGDRRRRPGDEDRLLLPVRPRDRQAALRRRRKPVPASDVPGEAGLADAARPRQAAAVLRAVFNETTSPTSARAAPRRRPRPARKISGAAGLQSRPARRGPSSSPASTAGRTGPAASFDPTTGLLYVNSNNVPNIITLVECQARRTAATTMAVRHHRLRPVPRPRGLPGDQAALGRADAIDLNTGEFAWQVPLGEYPGADRPRRPAHRHRKLRRLDRDRRRPGVHRRHQGRTVPRLRQSHRQAPLGNALPAGGYATPCTYRVNGKQYVAIAAGGGGKQSTKSGDTFVTFALP